MQGTTADISATKRQPRLDADRTVRSYEVVRHLQLHVVHQPLVHVRAHSARNRVGTADVEVAVAAQQLVVVVDAIQHPATEWHEAVDVIILELTILGCLRLP